jgi:hypothetical protein
VRVGIRGTHRGDDSQPTAAVTSPLSPASGGTDVVAYFIILYEICSKNGKNGET